MRIHSIFLAAILSTTSLLLGTSVAMAGEARPTAFLTAAQADAEDCEWLLSYGFVSTCTPGMLGIGVDPSVHYWLQYAQIQQIKKVKNNPKFCKGLKGKKLSQCLKGSHYTRTTIPTAKKCAYETRRDSKGNLYPECVLERYFAETGALEPGNYALNLYEDTPGQWKCSIYYEEVCRWSKGYSNSEDILFTWTGSEIQSERAAPGSVLIP